MPRFSMDYGFLGQDDNPVQPMLVVCELSSPMARAMLVPQKGIGPDWVETRIAAWINDIGL